MQEELLEPLKLIYRSLMDSGDAYIAQAHILDVIRQACKPRIQIPALTHWSISATHCLAMLYIRAVSHWWHSIDRPSVGLAVGSLCNEVTQACMLCEFGHYRYV